MCLTGCCTTKSSRAISIQPIRMGILRAFLAQPKCCKNGRLQTEEWFDLIEYPLLFHCRFCTFVGLYPTFVPHPGQLMHLCIGRLATTRN